jgi:outer membrane protein
MMCTMAKPDPRVFRWMALGLVCVVASAQADDDGDGDGKPRRAGLPLWEVGVFAAGLSQQAYPGADQQVNKGLLLPYAVYRGQVLRADDGGAGLRAVRTDRFELDVSLTGRFGAGSRSLRAREGMRRLGTLVEFGPVARWYLNGRETPGRVIFELPVRGVFDAGDRLRHQGLSAEPGLSVRQRLSSTWGYSLSASVLLGDRRLGSALYGVATAEALPDRPAYGARGGLIAWRLGATVLHQLTPDLRVIGFGRLESVAGAANRDSPLVRRTTGMTVGLGLTYVFARSAARASD